MDVGKSFLKGVFFVLPIIGGILFLKLLRVFSWWEWALFILFIFIGLIMIIVIHEDERGLSEFLGRYWKPLRPGPQLLPYPFVQLKGKVSLREQSIELGREQRNSKEKTLWMNCKDGKVGFLNPEVWVRLVGVREENEKTITESMKKSFYSVDDWKQAIRKLILSKIEGVVDGLTISEVEKEKSKGWWNLIHDKYPQLPDIVGNWGYEVTLLTVDNVILKRSR